MEWESYLEVNPSNRVALKELMSMHEGEFLLHYCKVRVAYEYEKKEEVNRKYFEYCQNDMQESPIAGPEEEVTTLNEREFIDEGKKAIWDFDNEDSDDEAVGSDNEFVI